MKKRLLLSKSLGLVLFALISFSAHPEIESSSTNANVPRTGNYGHTSVVNVQGVGPTIEDAKKNGFRRAIEEVVGTVLLSSQEAQGNQLTKDQINEYSAGYIDYYEMLDSYQDAHQQWVVDMKVRVASSKIAMRMLSSSNSVTRQDGERFQAAIESQLASRQSGDQLLTEVLTSYPGNAYIINQGQTEMHFNQYRQPELTIPLKIKMSQFWLESFNEALSIVAVDPVPADCNKFLVNFASALAELQRTFGPPGGVRKRNGRCFNESISEPDIRITYKKGTGALNTTHSYNMPDKRSLEVINSQLSANYIGILITAYYNDGTSDIVCNRVPTADFLKFVDPKGVSNSNDGMRYVRPDIRGHKEFDGSLTLTFSPDKLGKLEKLDLNLQKEC